MPAIDVRFEDLRRVAAVLRTQVGVLEAWRADNLAQQLGQLVLLVEREARRDVTEEAKPCRGVA